MPLYFITEQVTREGMMTVKEAPGRAQGVVQFASKFGVRIIEFFYCTSQFDFIMKVEAADEQSVAAFVMAVRKSGNVTARFTRAYSPDEWASLIDRIPD